MPRVNGVYTPPSGTKGVPNTTIQSAKYNSLVDDLTADANAARPVTAGGTGATSASGARTALGVEPGTNVQAFDALLQSIAGLTTVANQIIYTTGTDVVAVATITTYGRSLIDDADAAAARTTLGLGSLATASSVNDANWSGADLSIANGGTGASTAAAALTALGAAASAITITAGTGLSGGGNLTANRSFSVDYGTAAGTAAQGNDSRIVNAVPNTRTVAAGTGLTGGGALSANVALAVDSTVWRDASPPTGAQVGSLMAGLAVNSVGTYAFLRYDGDANFNPGATTAGSNLLYSNANGSSGGTSPTGTWRCMSRQITGNGPTNTGLWLKIA